MAVRTIGTEKDKVYNAQLVDVSTASVAYIPIAHYGVLIDGLATISASLTTADGTVTVKKYPAGVSGSAVTLGTITLVQASSAAGLAFRMVMSGSEADRTFEVGDVLALDADGSCDTTAIGRFSMIIRGL